MKRLSYLFAAIIWLPLIMASRPEPQAPPTETIIVPLPGGLTAHLENPQVFIDGAGVIFAATRPNSGVGGLVWKIVPGGQPEIVLPIDPGAMYALGEFVIWPDGYLRYVTVEKEDHTFLKAIPVPGWAP